MGRPSRRSAWGGRHAGPGCGVATEFTGDGRLGEAAFPEGVTRASLRLGPVVVLLRHDSLRLFIIETVAAAWLIGNRSVRSSRTDLPATVALHTGTGAFNVTTTYLSRSFSPKSCIYMCRIRKKPLDLAVTQIRV